MPSAVLVATSRSVTLPNGAPFQAIAFLVLVLLISARRACQGTLGVPLLTARRSSAHHSSVVLAVDGARAVLATAKDKNSGQKKICNDEA